MAINVSAPVKIFALVAVLAGVALIGGMTFMGREDAVAADTPIVLPKKRASAGVTDAPAAAKKVAKGADAAAKGKAAKTAPAAKPAAKAAAKRAAPAPAAAAAKPAPAPAPAPKPAAKPKPKPVAANGLPSAIATALERHAVVVVSLWGTGGKIDEMARDEAAAGAAAARAGFVALNVIESSAAAEALTLKLGVVLRTPTVLYFTSSGELANRLDGFRDRETVAQGAIDTLR